MEEKLKGFGAKVDALIKGNDISRGEAREMFRQVLLNQQPDLQQGAFLAALTAKGATPEELAGSWEAIYEIDTVKVSIDAGGPLVDNCGTGMDTLKTFNISTAAAIIAAADGVRMAKHGARAITSRCGTVDIVEALGVDVECDATMVKRSIENAGIGMFNGMSPKTHPQALYRILSQVRFGTVLNIAASLANPAMPTYGVRGVYSKEMIMPTIRTMKEIGYERALVLHGTDASGARGLDEASTIGPTYVAELHADGEVAEWRVDPAELGIARAAEKDILCHLDKEREALLMLRLFGGEDRGPRRDIVCLNAAPVLCVSGRADGLAEGYAIAGDILESGRAAAKLKEWVRWQNAEPGPKVELLERMMERAAAAP
jgi:anthranilate phosphoribosyltransferase